MKIPTEVRLCWDFFLGGALVSSAPTAQKCTNRAEMHQPRRTAPFTLLVQQRLLHPLEVHQPRRNAPTALTIRGYVGVRGYGRDAIPSYNSSP